MAATRNKKRRKRTSTPRRPLPADPTVEELLDRVRELEQENGRLQGEVRDWKKQTEYWRKAAKRQAAPFRRERPAPPKSPRSGRPRGRPVGDTGRRGRRRPTSVDREVKALALCSCPHCGDSVSDVSTREQFVEDIPPVRPTVTRIQFYVGHCDNCGQVESLHPEQVSRATGAAGVQIGPNALAFATLLNKVYGLSTRKTSEVMREGFGFHITPGGIVQAEHRLARGRLGHRFNELTESLRQRQVLHIDETSWWMGRPHWLWVFSNRDCTVFKVRKHRNADVVHNVIGKNFGGVVVSDNYVIYGSIDCVQQKCMAHHLKELSARLQSSPDEPYLMRWRVLLKQAMAIGRIRTRLTERQLRKRIKILERDARRLMRERPLNEDALKFRNRLARYPDSLLTFLYLDYVDPTNNQAERDIRPAVITRKISCGNRTRKGARTWEVFASLAATAKKQNEHFPQTIRDAALLVRPEASE